MISMRNALLCAGILFSSLLWAQDQLTFRTELNKTRYQDLVETLRCPKCQNQSLADSSAGIAMDLRNKVHQMIEQGKTDQEIIDYMVARYGDFVLYRPVYSSATLLLWYGPFIFLGIGGLVFFMVIRANRKRQRRVR